MSKILWIAMLASVLISSAGCRNTCNRQPLFARNEAPGRTQFVVPPQPTPLLPNPPPGAIQQSGGFPTLPPGAVVNPPPGAKIVQPGGAPPSISNAPPVRNEAPWQPGEGREPAPRPEPSRDVPPRIQLYAPEAIDKDKSEEPRKPGVLGTFPAIPQFTVAKENVFAGLRAPLDGLDWLQQNGVQTVVQLRLFGEDDSADKKQVEKRNMRYVAFEISPVTLTKDKADEFVKLIRDGAKQGIFVYDLDGSLAGSMWYLYLRQGEVLDDDAAQLRARQLGLQANRDGQHRDMWLAVQKLLSENNR